MVVYQKGRMGLERHGVQQAIILPPLEAGRYSLLCESSLTYCPPLYWLEHCGLSPKRPQSNSRRRHDFRLSGRNPTPSLERVSLVEEPIKKKMVSHKGCMGLERHGVQQPVILPPLETGRYSLLCESRRRHDFRLSGRSPTPSLEWVP
jgi:hypothetical protein